MFEIKNKSLNGQYQFLCDRKLRITWHRQNRKSWSRVHIPRHGPIFHLHIIKIWQLKKNTYMHFEEESIICIWSKFQRDTCMFDSNILLTKFGPGFWSRVPGVGPGFYSFPLTSHRHWFWRQFMIHRRIWRQFTDTFEDSSPTKFKTFLHSCWWNNNSVRVFGNRPIIPSEWLKSTSKTHFVAATMRWDFNMLLILLLHKYKIVLLHTIQIYIPM